MECPITAFRATADQIVDTGGVEEWAVSTEEKFLMEEISGDHFLINHARDRLLETIVERLRG